MMITKENYIEIGGVDCTECKSFLDWDLVDSAMKSYGLIALTNDPGEIPHLYNSNWKISHDNYFFKFGFSCPKCKKTIFFDCDFMFAEKVFDGELLKNKEATIFMYESNMFDSNFPVRSVRIDNSISCSMSFSGNYKFFERIFDITTVDKLPFRMHDRNDRFKGRLVHESDENDFVINCFPPICDRYAIGPAITVPLYLEGNKKDTTPLKDMDEQDFFNYKNIIKKFQQIENDTGEKAFNRFIPYDPIYPNLNRFCFEHSDRLRMPRQFDKFGNCLSYDLSLSYFDSDKYIITRNIQFLELLNFPDESPEAIKNFPPSLLYSKKHLLRDDSGSFLSKNFDRKIKPSEYEIINNDIWKEFNKSYLQQLLSKLSNNFIEEYIKIVIKQNCTFESIWNLKDEYLIKILDSIKSRYKREKINNEQESIQQERVTEIESKYPTLRKIVSNAYEINKLKEKISFLSKINKIDSFLLLKGVEIDSTKLV